MRHPIAHRFLARAGPAIIVFIGSCIGLVAALAPTYPGVKTWGETQFFRWWPVVRTPWFWGVVMIIIALYVFFVVWTRREPTVKLDTASLRQPTGPDQLYLFKNQTYNDTARKSYLVVWSPSEYFVPIFTDYDSRSRSWPPAEPAEKRLTVYLYNPGPDDLRHLKIQWDLGDLDVENRIRNTGLFEGYIDKLIDVRVELYNEAVGWIGRPFSTQEMEEIPLIKAGDTLAIQAPEAINWAFAFYALTESKRISATSLPDLTGSLRDNIIAMQSDTIPFEPIIVSIEYVGEDLVKRTQAFGLTGEIRGRVATISQKAGPDDGNTYSAAPGGITAAIDHIEIYRA